MGYGRNLPSLGLAMSKLSVRAVGAQEWQSHLDHCSRRDALTEELLDCLEQLPNGAAALALLERLQDLQTACDTSACDTVKVMEAALVWQNAL